MSVTPEMIAVALGVAAPDPDSAKYAQWSMWIVDALMLINDRKDEVGVTADLDAAKLDYVVREAVKAYVQRPDDATQVTVAVDDGSTSRTYRSSKGRIEILDEWWKLLGLVGSTSGAFSVDTTGGYSLAGHSPWCSLFFGGPTCSCGANLTAGTYPLWEW